MHYEINVSHNGRHLFATHARSITNTSDLQRVAPEIMARFPTSEGFEVTATHYFDDAEFINLSDVAVKAADAKAADKKRAGR